MEADKEDLFGSPTPLATNGDVGREEKKDNPFGEPMDDSFLVTESPKPPKLEQSEQQKPIESPSQNGTSEKHKEKEREKGKEKEKEKEAEGKGMEEISVSESPSDAVESDKIYDISINETHTITEREGDSITSFTIYHIALHTLTSPEPHLVWRRYKQFVAFHDQITKFFPKASLPSLPGRTLFGDPLGKNVIQARQLQLEKYLKELLVSQPDIFFSFHTRIFLGLYDLSDRVAIVTGASSGLGFEVARSLASLGAHVIMACRNAEKTGPLVEQLKKETGNKKIEFLTLNLASIKSVRHFVGLFHARELPLHILINNAGHLGGAAVTEDSFEGHMGVNYIGHFLLTHLLLEDLQSVPDARVVNVIGSAYERATAIDFDSSFLRAPSPPSLALDAYDMSKLALVLFTHELAQRLKSSSVIVNAVSPGTASTQLWRNIPQTLSWMMKRFMRDAETSSKAILYCAIAPETGASSGRYYDGLVEKAPTVASRDYELMSRLWEESERWVGLIDDQY